MNDSNHNSNFARQLQQYTENIQNRAGETKLGDAQYNNIFKNQNIISENYENLA